MKYYSVVRWGGSASLMISAMSGENAITVKRVNPTIVSGVMLAFSLRADGSRLSFLFGTSVA